MCSKIHLSVHLKLNEIRVNGFFSLTSVKKILYFKTMSGNICEKVANWYLHKKNLTLKIIYKETSKLLEN